MGGRPCGLPPVLLGSGQRLRVGGGERLHAGLFVAIERRHAMDAGGGGAEVVVRGIGEPHADLVELDALALTVGGQRARERLVDDGPELVFGVAVAVGGDVAEVLGGAERCAGLLEQEDRVGAIGGQRAGADVENVEAPLLGGRDVGDLHRGVRHARGELGVRRRQAQFGDRGRVGGASVRGLVAPGTGAAGGDAGGVCGAGVGGGGGGGGHT